MSQTTTEPPPRLRVSTGTRCSLCRKERQADNYYTYRSSDKSIMFGVYLCDSCREAVHSLSKAEREAITGLEDFRNHKHVGGYLNAKSVRPSLTWREHQAYLASGGGR